MDKLHYQIALSFVPQIGAVLAKSLVRYCGSAEAVFKAGRRELMRVPGIGPAVAQAFQSPEPLLRAERELEFMEQHGIQAIFFTHPCYPSRLRQCADAPAMFYFKGSSIQLLEAERIIAVVGTRQPSDYGRAICEEIIEGLQAFNVLIVSGLAYGVDVTAHRKASALGMANIGVLGHGLGSIYPAQHKSVAMRMIENGGLVSEYAHEAKPDREHFPMRNRIISGLSDALLVVETAASGGSMITVDCAERQSREVFAVPGRPRDEKSAGCNLLIKNERAKLVESAADIAHKMGWDSADMGRPVQTKLFQDLSPEESILVDIIRDRPQIPIDELTVAAQMPPGRLASSILALEFRGILRTLPGKRYVVS